MMTEDIEPSTNPVCDACATDDGPLTDWAGKQFCEACLKERDLDHISVSDLHERHAPSRRRSAWNQLCSAVVTALTIVFVGMPCGGLIRLMWELEDVWLGNAREVDPGAVLEGVLIVPLGVWVVSVFVIPTLTLWRFLVPTRREVSLIEDHLRIETRKRSLSLPLEFCTWTIRRFAREGWFLSWSRRPFIEIACNNLRVRVGESPEKFLLWMNFLRLYGTAFFPSPTIWRLIGIFVPRVLLGYTVGGLVGFALAEFFNDVRWIPIGVVFGFQSGLSLGVFQVALSTGQLGVERRAQLAAESILASLGTGFTLGMAFKGVFIVIGLVIGGVLGWFIAKSMGGAVIRVPSTPDDYSPDEDLRDGP